jgi:uncharacterized protein (DUF1015 family)
MANIRPFPGLLYNRNLTGDLRTVLAPPWDVIDENLRQDLARRSAYNIIRLIARDADPQEVKKTFEKWRSDGILVPDKKTCFYYLKHTFLHQGKQLIRQGILALLELEDFSTGNIVPHENIFPEHRDNRYRLIEQCRANFSPVFMLYQDADRTMEEIGQGLKECPGTEFNGDTLRFAGISEEKTVQKITSFFRGRKLFIADGHHRYQAALDFYKNNPVPKNRYVLVYLADLHAPELVICPTHRYVPADVRFEERKQALAEFFEIERVASQAEMFRRMVNTGGSLTRFGVYGQPGFFVLTLKNQDSIRPFLPAGYSETYRFLDVVVLHRVVLEQVLGMKENASGAKIAYERNPENLIEKRRQAGKGLVFFLNPVPKEQFIAVVNKREVMPHKSTYFFPKVPSGLVIHRF